MVDTLGRFLTQMGGFETLTFSFYISLLLLLLISFLKYFIQRKSELKEWWLMMLELPIDVCVILITIIVTGYMRGVNGVVDEKNAAIGVFLIFASLIISVICCYLRRVAMNCSYSQKRMYIFYSFICGVFNFIVAGIWIYVIFQIVVKHE